MRTIGIVLTACLTGTALPAQAALRPSTLRCEYLESPLGIDTPRPRLSWQVESRERGQRQTAYRIIVATSPERLAAGEADLWDSGRVDSDATAQIYYAGKPPTSRQQCFWKVLVWDRDGVESTSDVARWEMGLLDPADWQAKWIARTTETASNPAPLLRRGFGVARRVRQARLYIAGLGYHEVYINGQRVGDHILDPGYTRYDRRVLYVTHDVTALLRDGANAIGVMLGNGWFNTHTKAVWYFHEAPWRMSPRMLLHLRVDYADGGSETIVSDESWRVATGAITFDSIYAGETYDARLAKPGWDRDGYDDSGWEPALVVDAPRGKLSAQMTPPIRSQRPIRPVSITEPKPGVFVFDMGQNMAGRAELTVSGPAGTKVVMRYGERVFADGGLDRASIEEHMREDSSPFFQTDTYILSGEGEERWHSRFTYHGFQYVEVTGFPGRPTLDSLLALPCHSDIPVAGSFECSIPLLNKIQHATVWAFLANLQSIPTDCPHREKNGWTGDAQIACEQAQYNFLPVATHTKWLDDLGDEQQPSGQLPGIVPTSGWGYSWGNGPAWDSAFYLLPYYEYVYYGDTGNLAQHYEGIRRYVDYLTTRAQGGIVEIGLNDWAPWRTQTGAAITDTAYYYVGAQVVALAAEQLGKPDDQARYLALAESIKQAFNARFYHPETGLYDNGSQTALSCALYQGLVEPANRERVAANLVAAVEANDNHIDTGILGAKYILNALTESGRSDVAYRMVAQKDQPGWGWWMEQGATTLWEQWDGGASRCHIMFGDVGAWFYKALAGIRPDPEAPGFAHFTIRPEPVGHLTWVRAHYDSIRGRIESAWEKAGGHFTLYVRIPANTTATVYLPAADLEGIVESDKPLAASKGVRALGLEGDRAVLEVASGTYEFRSRMP